MTYIIGMFALIVGVFMVIKTEWFLQNFGSIAWADEHLGSDGGSRLAYKLLGILAILISLMGMTGLLGPLILAILGPLFGIR